MGIDI
jgi:translation initiation factor 2 subunit 1